MENGFDIAWLTLQGARIDRFAEGVENEGGIRARAGWQVGGDDDLAHPIRHGLAADRFQGPDYRGGIVVRPLPFEPAGQLLDQFLRPELA